MKARMKKKIKKGESGLETRRKRTECIHNKHMKVCRKWRQQGGLGINLLTQQVCHAVSLLGGPLRAERGGENVNLGTFSAGNYTLSLG